MKKIILIIILSSFTFLMACEDDVNIELPEVDPKLVIFSYISPQDTIIDVVVASSIPIYEEMDRNFYFNNKIIEDATVIMSEGASSIQLTFDSVSRSYTADTDIFPIVAGKTYNLTVNDPGGLFAEGSCTVPAQNNTLSVVLDSLGEDENGIMRYTLDLDWQFLQNSAGYRIHGEIEYTINENDSTYTRYRDLYFGDAFFTLVSPATTSKNLRTYDYLSGSKPTKQLFYISLINTEDHYFKYHTSFLNRPNDNPFAEPAPLYTNIKGGLGVFAAYNSYTVTVEF